MVYVLHSYIMPYVIESHECKGEDIYILYHTIQVRYYNSACLPICMTMHYNYIFCKARIYTSDFDSIELGLLSNPWHTFIGSGTSHTGKYNIII